MDAFERAILHGGYRDQLIAVRDKIVHELTVKKCNHCEALQLRTGDTAALILRLTTVLKEIQELPSPDEESDLDRIRERRPIDELLRQAQQ